MENYIKIKNYISNIEKYKIVDKEESFINYKLLSEDIDNLNKDLIISLLNDSLCKEIFFNKINDVFVFNQRTMIDIMFNQNEYLDGSLTKYDNKIGLFVKDINTVQLNFPYKDCVLVGGMDKEDDKINSEIFYNETIDKDKINKLFEPKIFHNIEKFSFDSNLKQDEQLDNPNNIQIDTNIDKIRFETIVDENGIEKKILKDNLLIKGNNLLGLHSLSKRLSNSIDVIYIDPPYYFNQTKASDSFAYNSNFKLSTWLTFMKNRLEIAKELLSDDGVIFISMNEDGNSYLKLLCDEIFGVNNFYNHFKWKKNNKSSNLSNKRVTLESILCYSKNNKMLFTKFDKSQEDFKDYAFFNSSNNYKELNFPKNTIIYNIDDCIIPKGIYKDNKSLIELFNDIEIKDKKIINDFKLAGNWRYSQKALDTFILNNEHLEIKGAKLKPYWRNTEERIKAISDYLDYDNYLIETNESANQELFNIFNIKDKFSYSKPYSLIKTFVESFQQKDCIVLDFFAGSGTTGQAVMDLNKEDGGTRKFIMLEQMDYIKDITCERLKRSMIKENYEDSFIYMEMFESDLKILKNRFKSINNLNLLKDLINLNFDLGYFININNKQSLFDKLDKIYNKKQDLNLVIKTLIEKYMDNNLDYNSYEDLIEYKSLMKDNEYELNKSFYGVN